METPPHYQVLNEIAAVAKQWTAQDLGQNPVTDQQIIDGERINAIYRKNGLTADGPAPLGSAVTQVVRQTVNALNFAATEIERVKKSFATIAGDVEVWVFLHTHKYGIDISVHESEELAQNAADSEVAASFARLCPADTVASLEEMQEMLSEKGEFFEVDSRPVLRSL